MSKTSKVIDQKIIARAGNAQRTYLSLWEQIIEVDGRRSSYFSVARGDACPIPTARSPKLPDAVVIVAFLKRSGEEKRLVLLNEFRPAIHGREISFPAGLIGPEDYKQEGVEVLRSTTHAAMYAAQREMKEETGLDFLAMSVSPDNLYSSAGMTNESVCIVEGIADGDITTKDNESDEDIRVMLLTEQDVVELVSKAQRGEIKEAFSKVVWPYLWLFSQKGFV